MIMYANRKKYLLIIRTEIILQIDWNINYFQSDMFWRNKF